MLYKVNKSSGILERILINKIIDIPFPTPFSVILSPNHIKNVAPAVKDDDELYLEDMVGFTATFKGRDDEGRIVDFEDSDWNPLFIIELDGREVMIPAVDDFIVEYSPSRRSVLFELPEGLLELN